MEEDGQRGPAEAGIVFWNLWPAWKKLLPAGGVERAVRTTQAEPFPAGFPAKGRLGQRSAPSYLFL
ncbi:MAG: hypothetical protein SCH98_06280 [Deferrisomatales bacterium]|nr:hypothetical protein [Deferrisomatales bacterium]